MAQVIILADIWLNRPFPQLLTAFYSHIKSERKNYFSVVLLKILDFVHPVLCQHPAMCCEFNEFSVIFMYFEFMKLLFRLL